MYAYASAEDPRGEVGVAGRGDGVAGVLERQERVIHNICIMLYHNISYYSILYYVNVYRCIDVCMYVCVYIYIYTCITYKQHIYSE